MIRSIINKLQNTKQVIKFKYPNKVLKCNFSEVKHKENQEDEDDEEEDNEEYFQLKSKLEDYLVPHKDKNQPPVFKIAKKSIFLKDDPFNKPKIRTVKDPETQEEKKQKFNLSPNFTSKFEVNPNNFDDYLVVGAEVFKNLYKDLAMEGKFFEAAEKGITYLTDNTIIKEKRGITSETYGPIREDFYYVDTASEMRKFETTRDWINAITDEKLRPIFVPSYREKSSRYNALVAFKTQFKNNNRDEHNKDFLRKLSFAPSFNAPFNIYNEKIENILIDLKRVVEESRTNFLYPNNPDFALSGDKISRCVDMNSFIEVSEFFSAENCLKISESIKYLKEEIENISPNLIPNLLMRFFFECNLNIRSIWMKLEEIILNSINNYSIGDISKIYFVSNIVSPKYSSQNFRNQLKAELLKNKFENYSFSDISDIIAGLKQSKDSILFSQISSTLSNNVEKYLNTKSSLSKEQIICNLAFGLSYCKPSQYKKLDYLGLKEDNSNNYMNIHDFIIEYIPKMNIDQMLLILEATARLEIEHCDMIINKIEREFTKYLTINSKVQLSTSQIGSLLKQLNQMRKGKMGGKDNFIRKVLIHSMKNIDHFEINDFLEVMYSSSARRLEFNSEGISDEEYKSQILEIQLKVMEKLKSHIKENKINTFSQLSLVFYHLMFIRSEDSKLIDSLLEIVNKIDGVLQVKYYTSFKLFDFYIRNHKKLKNIYNYENLVQFRDRFFYSEQVYNIVKDEHYFLNELRLLDIDNTLSNRLFYHTTKIVPHENLFTIPICLETRKIGIFIYFERDYIPNTKKVSSKALLSSYILSLYDDWEVISLSWDEYLNFGNHIDREKAIFNLIEAKTDEQIKKGLYVRNRRYIY